MEKDSYLAFIKVTTGRFRGRKIQAPKGLTTRPTSAKAREAVGSILMDYWQDSEFLDLFSGSGIMGVEALSRGSRWATFVDQDRNSVATIRKNLETLGADTTTILPVDVKKSYNSLQPKRFDIIWADPPYDQVPKWLDWFALHVPKLLSTNGIFALESRLDDQALIESQLGQSPQLHLDKSKRYGQSLISFFRHSSPER